MSSAETLVRGRITSSRSSAVRASIRMRNCVVGSPLSSLETVAWRACIFSPKAALGEVFLASVAADAGADRFGVRAIVSMVAIYVIAHKSSIYAIAYKRKIYAVAYRAPSLPRGSCFRNVPPVGDAPAGAAGHSVLIAIVNVYLT